MDIDLIGNQRNSAPRRQLNYRKNQKYLQQSNMPTINYKGTYF